ncbi:MAG: Ni-sirohydrochlorin a,c-diamide reductive cyclase catalytic subunit [Candidatus Syntropharchaeales archaeon]
MEMEIGSGVLHPRPSAIAASMYTLRDLDVDAILMHGPPGCNFRTSRILEEDGVRVFTTSMTEYDFIFGGRERLVEILKYIDREFSFRRIGVVGTCASMIIGEDMEAAIEDARLDMDVILVETHGGYAENTKGAIKALEAAERKGLISKAEFLRQEKILLAATRIEEDQGMASAPYIAPLRGDDKFEVAETIIREVKARGKLTIILNAKKELAYIFSDMLLALTATLKPEKFEILNIANLDPDVGLPRIRGYAKNILKAFSIAGIEIDHLSGGLDEYAISGAVAYDLVKEMGYDNGVVVVLGNPNAVKPIESAFTIAVTNGPREVVPLKRLGYDRVVVELDAHSLVVGVSEIVRSEFGDVIRRVGVADAERSCQSRD